MSNFVPSVRVTKPTGGDSHHNLFSWDDGSSIPPPPKPSHINRKNLESAAETDDLVVHRRPGSETKQRELSGSGIFSTEPLPVKISSNAYANNNNQNNGNVITDRPSVRVHHPAGGASQIVFGSEADSVFKPRLSPLKVQELAGTSQTVEDVRSKKKSFLEAKQKDLGSEPLFTPILPNRIAPAPTPPPFATSHVVAGPDASFENSSRRVSEQKIADLKGRGVYQESPPSFTVSDAKKKEMQGCLIFGEDETTAAGNSKTASKSMSHSSDNFGSLR